MRIVGGEHAGESATVLEHKKQLVLVAIDETFREIKVKCGDLRIKSELDRLYNPASMLLNKDSTKYSAADLVTFQNNQISGFVLQVQEDCLRLLTEKGEIRNVKYPEISKKIPFDRKASTQDLEGNEISNDITVKVIKGPKTSKIGVVKRIYKKYVFMWNKDFKQSNGYFVE